RHGSQHGPERFDMCKLVLPRYRAVQHWRDEEAFNRNVTDLTFSDETYTRSLNSIYERRKPFELRSSDDRAALNIGIGHANTTFRNCRGNSCDDVVIYLSLDKQAATSRAGLACVLHDCADNNGHRLVQVGISEDNLRGLSP